MIQAGVQAQRRHSTHTRPAFSQNTRDRKRHSYCWLTYSRVQILRNLSFLYSPGLKAKQTHVPTDSLEKPKFPKVDRGLEPVQSPIIPPQNQRQFTCKFFHRHHAPRATARERKEGQLHTRSRELCQNEKSLRHEAKQTLQYSGEKEISYSLREPFPEGLTVAEKGKGCCGSSL